MRVSVTHTHRIAKILAIFATLLTSQLHAKVGEFFDSSVQIIAGGGASCDTFDFYEQPLVSYDTVRISDTEDFIIPAGPDAGTYSFTTAEARLDTLNTIIPLDSGFQLNGIRAWGFSGTPIFDAMGDITSFNTCAEPDSTPFEITFYADNAGQPGSLLTTRTEIASVTTTSFPFTDDFVKQYDIDFSTRVISASAAWVGVRRQTGLANCYWGWLDDSNAASHDNIAYQFDDPALIQDSDQSMCLAGEPFVPISVPTLSKWSIVIMIGLFTLLGFTIRHRLKRL